MMDRGRRAIVYVAWGERHVREAIESARTASIVGVDRLLITNSSSLQFIGPSSPFEKVIEHEFVLVGQLAKTEMFALLPINYDSFLFLDSDTFILMDIDQGFEKAEKYGIAAAQAASYSLEHFWGFDSVLGNFQIKSREILQYNSGVIFFVRNEFVWRVLMKWHELCSNAVGDVSAWGDQPYFTLAMELLDFNPYTLSVAYNYRNFGELASGHIRIWHSHLPPPDGVNDFDHAWPPRRFVNGEIKNDSF